MQEPKEDKASRVLLHMVAEHKSLQLVYKERRLKRMNSRRVNKLSVMKSMNAKKNGGLNQRSIICK